MSNAELSNVALSEIVEATATKFGVPGIAAGVWVNGQAVFAAHGVTSIENPVPVNEDTLFALSSISKSYTASVIMKLVDKGRIDLDAPVRTYVPELELSDERIAAQITVKQLLNHTAGLEWSIINDTGEGDDGLAKFVAELKAIPLIAEPGTRASYSQAGYNLVGRIIENVTGLTYEKAVATMILEPAGLNATFFGRDEIMTRRFALGHERDEDGNLVVQRVWKGTRANNAGGGIAATAADLLRWGRVHLADGRAENGAEIVPAARVRQMQQQTAELRASALGDGFGLCWFLREIDGVRTYGHGGSGFGQFAELLIVPDRDVVIVVMSNASPDGLGANQSIVRWALEHYLGIIDADPEPLPHDPARAAEISGRYEIDAMTAVIATDGDTLTLECKIRPEIRAASETELPQDHPPFVLGLLPNDEYMITEGSFQGQRGFFSRNESGAITGFDLAGRLFSRTS
ncbi:serine hydrolase domain-containing protein [Nocardia sp. NPDC127526]|uniref:serine hydrolase domain-containing protein n=1 Tax=Nocardia sp. NPDC127526 TaxID=3345393 RepID=UPI003643D137